MNLKTARSVGEHVVALGILEIGKYIFGLIVATGVSAIIGTILATANQLSGFSKIVLIITFAAAGAWGYIVLRQRYSRLRPHFRRLDADYRLLDFKISYRYDDKTHLTYTKEKKLKALKHGLAVYQDKYCWTGTGTINMTSGIKGQTVQETVKKSVWQYYEIRFLQTLSKKEEVPTKIIWELDDTGGTARPFVSATIEEPTDFLELNLSLDPSLGVTEVICEESSNIGARKPFRSFSLTLNKDGIFSWPEHNPRLLHHYEMKWSF